MKEENNKQLDVAYSMSIIHIGYSELLNYLLLNMNVHQKEPIYKYIEMFTDVLCQAGMIIDTETGNMYPIKSIIPNIDFDKSANESFSIALDVSLADDTPIPFAYFISNKDIANVLSALWNKDNLTSIFNEHNRCDKYDDDESGTCIHEMIVYLSYMTDLICTATQIARYYFMENLMREEHDPSKPYNQIATQLHLQHIWNRVANEVNSLVEIDNDGTEREALLAPKAFVNKENLYSIEFCDLIVKFRETKKKNV